MYTFLSSSLYSDSLAATILKGYIVDVNTLSWMKYHKVDVTLWVSCVNFSQKRKTGGECCVICQAQTGRKFISNYQITTGPECLSNDRQAMCQTVQSYNKKYDFIPNTSKSPHFFHFTIWSLIHDSEISVYSNMQSFEREYLNWYIKAMKSTPTFTYYYHGEDQYGHSHIHCLSPGLMHDIRAFEILVKCQNAAKQGGSLVFSDVFHPITEFFKNCSATGQDYVISCYLIHKHRLNLSIRYENIPQFYQMAYIHDYNQIRDMLSDQ
jgi:hypothetical protein